MLKISVRHYPVEPNIVKYDRTLSGRAKHCSTRGFWSSKLRVGSCLGHVGHCLVGDLWKMWFSPKICPFVPKFDSWAIVLQIEWNLDTRVTSTQGTSSQKCFLSKSNDFPSDFGWNKKHRFWGNEEKSIKLKGLEPWIHSNVGVRWRGSS
jgi:hypothetical protein